MVMRGFTFQPKYNSKGYFFKYLFMMAILLWQNATNALGSVNISGGWPLSGAPCMQRMFDLSIAMCMVSNPI